MAVQRLRRRIATIIGLLGALALPACGGADQEVPGRPADADVRLAVRVDQGEDRVPLRGTLECTSDGANAGGALRGDGTARLCAHAREIAGFLASAPERDRICTSIYGGPQTARIWGTIGERAVGRAFQRTDGCEIAWWDEAVPLLPAVDGPPLPPPEG